MLQVTTVVIGAGHSGLAVSRHLAERGVDHVVLERGEVASSWRSQRWDSLRLLTPNWLSRLPGYAYRGDDPDGYMSAPQVAAFIEDYAKEIRRAGPGEHDGHRGAPGGRRVRRRDRPGDVAGAHGRRRRGRGDRPRPCPSCATACPPGSSTARRRLDTGPARLPQPRRPPDGGVLVVGPSASGIQIAQEVHASGRPVTLAVGEHVRMPRTYRGRDVLWWMDATGLFDDRYDEIPDLLRARVLPSMQLIGSPERATLDLNTLSGAGVRLVGRLAGVRDGVAQLSGSLPNVCTLADLKLKRLLKGFDEWAAAAGAEQTAGLPAGEPAAPTVVPAAPQELDLRSGEIRTIIWATGLQPDFGFLSGSTLPVFDRKGRVRHDGGVVTASPGLYVIGLPFLRRRKSTLIDGAGPDAADIVAHLVGHLA